MNLSVEWFCSCRLCKWSASNISPQGYQPDVHNDGFWDQLFEQRRSIQLAAISKAVKAGKLGLVQDLLSFQHVHDPSAQLALGSAMHQSGTAIFQLGVGRSLLHYANDGDEKLASALDRVFRQLKTQKTQPRIEHYIIKPYNHQVDGALSEIADLCNHTRLQLQRLFCTAPASQCIKLMRQDSDIGNDSSDDASAEAESVPVTWLPHIVLVVTVCPKEKRKTRDSDASQQGSAKKGKTLVSVSTKASSSAYCVGGTTKSPWRVIPYQMFFLSCYMLAACHVSLFWCKVAIERSADLCAWKANTLAHTGMLHVYGFKPGLLL